MHDAYKYLTHGLNPNLVMKRLQEERKNFNKTLPNPLPEEDLGLIQLPKETIQQIIGEDGILMHGRELTEQDRCMTDVSWSPPKSFSVLHAMCDDNIIKKELEQALIDSVKETLTEWEKLAARRDKVIVRDEDGNKTRPDRDKTTGNIIYTSFLHYDTRPVHLPLDDETRQKLEAAGVQLEDNPATGEALFVDADGSKKPFVRDPQLHLHTPIANVTYDKDTKKWYALQKSEMMKQLPYFQAIASQKLASKLEKMGFALERAGSRWEIDAMATGPGRQMIDRFSKPAAALQDYKGEFNLSNASDRKNLNLIIRKNKEEGIKDPGLLQKIWRAQMDDADMLKIRTVLHNREINAEAKKEDAAYDFTSSLEHHKINEADCIDHVIAVESMRSAVFSTQDILAKAIHYGVTKDPKDIKKAFDKKVKAGEIILARTREKNPGAEDAQDAKPQEEVKPPDALRLQVAALCHHMATADIGDPLETTRAINTLLGLEDDRRINAVNLEESETIERLTGVIRETYAAAKYPTAEDQMGAFLGALRKKMGSKDYALGKYSYTEEPAKTVENSETPVNSGYFTTKALLEEEQKLVVAVKSANGRMDQGNWKTLPSIGEMYAKASKNPTYAPSTFPGGEYTDSQKSALQGVLSARDRVIHIQGDAGVGKTTVGLQLQRAVLQSGHRLISATVATMAKEVLENDGYGEIMLVDKDNNIVMEPDEETGKPKPKLAGRKEAMAHYKAQYGDPPPPHIANMLKQGAMEPPQTLSKLLLSYEGYKRKKAALKKNPAVAPDVKAFEARMKEQVLFIDEAGQLGTQQASQVMEMVKDLDMRLILVGDRKQHRSVTRGSVLDVLVDHAGIEPHSITDIRRQSGRLREVCGHMAKGEYGTAFAQLNDMGGVEQIAPSEEEATTGKKEKGKIRKNIRDLQEAFADEIVERMEHGEDPTIVIPDHATGQTIDEMIRERLATSSKKCKVNMDQAHTFETLERNNAFDSVAQRTVIANYSEFSKGLALQFLQNVNQIERGTVAKIVGIDTKEKTLTLKCTRKNGSKSEPFKIKLPEGEAEAKKFLVSTVRKTDLCPGDRITITKNIMVKGYAPNGKTKGRMLSNGRSFTVKEIREEGGEHVVVLDSGMGNEIVLRPESDPTHQNFQRQFYKTSYGAQGGTSDKGACMVFHIAKSNKANPKNGNLYVDLTRATGDGELGRNGKNNNLRVYTNDLRALVEEAQLINGQPNSALAFVELAKENPQPNKENRSITALCSTPLCWDWRHLQYHPEEWERRIGAMKPEEREQLAKAVDIEIRLAPRPPANGNGRVHKTRHRANMEKLKHILGERAATSEAHVDEVGRREPDMGSIQALMR